MSCSSPGLHFRNKDSAVLLLSGGVWINHVRRTKVSLMKKNAVLLALLCGVTRAFAQSGHSGEIPERQAFVLGQTLEIQSVNLNEKRRLNIYLPEGYKQEDTLEYPVIYLLDGSADEDFIHVAGLVQFNSFPWVNRLPPSIVVGIANVDRERDFTFPSSIAAERKRFPTSGKSAAFIDFIESELQPFIDRNYKTGRHRTLIGESLGGLLATEILLKKPALFNRYIIVSPSLWWDNGSLLQRLPAMPERGNDRETEVYIGVGKEGLGPSETPHVMEVDANVLADRLSTLESGKFRVHFDYLPDENHATIGHQAIFNAIKYFGRPKK